MKTAYRAISQNININAAQALCNLVRRCLLANNINQVQVDIACQRLRVRRDVYSVHAS